MGPAMLSKTSFVKRGFREGGFVEEDFICWIVFVLFFVVLMRRRKEEEGGEGKERRRGKKEGDGGRGGWGVDMMEEVGV